MPKQSIVAQDVYPTVGYPHAVRVGNTIYTVGLVGISRDKKAPEDFEGQCKLAWENMAKIMKAADAQMEDIVSFNHYVLEPANAQKAIGIRRSFFKDELRCGTLIVVEELAVAFASAAVEIAPLVYSGRGRRTSTSG